MADGHDGMYARAACQAGRSSVGSSGEKAFTVCGGGVPSLVMYLAYRTFLNFSVYFHCELKKWFKANQGSNSPTSSL
jgi:hypothetical protein